MRNGFSLDTARTRRTIPPILPSWRTVVLTKRGEHEAVCLTATTLQDTLGSDGPSNSPQRGKASISNARDFDRAVEALIIQHPRTHLWESQRPAKGKGKDGFKRVDNLNARWFRENGKGKHTGSGESGASAHHSNLTSVEPANAHPAHNDPVDPEAMLHFTRQLNWTQLLFSLIHGRRSLS